MLIDQLQRKFRDPLPRIALIVTAALLAALLSIALWQAVSGDDPDLRGTITEVTSTAADSARIRINPSTSPDDCAGAVLEVGPHTEIVRSDHGTAEVPISDLRIGQRVEAWFTGFIDDSCPPQTSAAKIVILDDPGNPDIRGTITQLTPGEGDTIGTILVEGEIEPDTGYDKASVRVDKGTEIIMARFVVEPTSARFNEMSEGDLVEVWFEGPVAESYPVQAKAGRIEVISLSTTIVD